MIAKNGEDVLDDSRAEEHKKGLHTLADAYEDYVNNVLQFLKNKIRNLEKKKVKFSTYEQKALAGEHLDSGQLSCLNNAQEMQNNLAFAQDLQKSFILMNTEFQKAQHKALQRDTIQNKEYDRKRLKHVIELQYVLEHLGHKCIRQDFTTGCNGAVLLSAEEFAYMDELYQLVHPFRDRDMSFDEQIDRASCCLYEYLSRSEKTVAGSTYKKLHKVVQKVIDSGYFETLPNYSSSDEEDQIQNCKVVLLGKSLQNPSHTSHDLTSKPTESLGMANSHSSIVLAKEFVNRNYVTAVESQKPNEGQKLQVTPLEKRSPKDRKWHELQSETSISEVRCLTRQDSAHQKLQNLIKQIQGTYSFLQDSVLDEDGPTKDKSPFTAPSSTNGLENARRTILQPVLEECHDMSSSSSTLSSSPTLLQPSVSAIELYGETSPKFVDVSGMSATPTACNSSQTILSCPSLEYDGISQLNGFCDASTTTTTAITSTTTASTAQVSTSSLFSHSLRLGGVDQSFNSTGQVRATRQADQPSNLMAQPVLPPFVPAAAAVQPANVVPTQGFHFTRGVRGRGPRFSVEGYRPANMYRTSFENYHPLYQPLQNAIYMQPSIPIHDMSGMALQRPENFHQQNYVRNAYLGMRGAMRSWSDSSHQASPEQDETFNSGDSGQGETRSITPIDVAMGGQGGPAILPVGLCPMPQQVRVAFSASRTYNFFPGILDQPISFDTLTTVLGECFDTMTGRFHCPINGTYIFFFHILKLAVNVPLYVNLMKNNEVLVSAYANDGAPDHETASNHVLIRLLQGDQVWLRLHRGTIYGSSWKYSTFSGYLIYLD
uniref:caprin-2 isoform X2 n=1 Tax=Myxine glutinosa TaxID=7769 RepID=UPI00358F73BD